MAPIELLIFLSFHIENPFKNFWKRDFPHDPIQGSPMMPIAEYVNF